MRTKLQYVLEDLFGERSALGIERKNFFRERVLSVRSVTSSKRLLFKHIGNKVACMVPERQEDVSGERNVQSFSDGLFFHRNRGM